MVRVRSWLGRVQSLRSVAAGSNSFLKITNCASPSTLMRFKELEYKPVPNCSRWRKSSTIKVLRGGTEMHLFRDMSIRHKLQGIVLAASGVALFVASAAFTIYDRTTFLRTKTEDLIASAKMIGSNSSAALTFHDSGSGREILSALQAKPHVMNACIYDSDGKVFAKYSRDPTEVGSCPPPAQTEGS